MEPAQADEEGGGSGYVGAGAGSSVDDRLSLPGLSRPHPLAAARRASSSSGVQTAAVTTASRGTSTFRDRAATAAAAGAEGEGSAGGLRRRSVRSSGAAAADMGVARALSQQQQQAYAGGRHRTGLEVDAGVESASSGVRLWHELGAAECRAFPPGNDPLRLREY